MLFGSLFIVIVYFMSAQPIEWIRFSQFMAIGLFTGYISEGLGILIGSSVNNSVSSEILQYNIIRIQRFLENKYLQYNLHFITPFRRNVFDRMTVPPIYLWVCVVFENFFPLSRKTLIGTIFVPVLDWDSVIIPFS